MLILFKIRIVNYNKQFIHSSINTGQTEKLYNDRKAFTNKNDTIK